MDGIFSVISQLPVLGMEAVSTTKYESLRVLAGRMSLRSVDQIEEIGAREGFAVKTRRALELPSGKVLWHAMFQAGKAAL